MTVNLMQGGTIGLGVSVYELGTNYELRMVYLIQDSGRG